MATKPAPNSAPNSSNNAKQLIGNAVKMAQDYELNNQEQEAYQYYLYAIQHILSQLQHISTRDMSSKCGVPPDKLFNLATSCLDSANRLMKEAAKEKREFTSAQQRSMPSRPQQPALMKSSSISGYGRRTASFGPGNESSDQTPPIRHHSVAVSSGNNFRRKPQVRKGGRQLSGPRLPSSSDDNTQPVYHISPMDKAEYKNIHLMQQYKASLRRDSVKMLGDSRQNLTLNYLRRMEENRSVARINEQILARKGKERAARLRQENQKTKLSHLRKSMDSMSVEDLSQEVTVFEQGKSNIQSIKQKLSANPNSSSLACDLINEVLNCCDHPLSKLLGECQFSITQFLQPVVKKIESTGRLPYCSVSSGSLDQPVSVISTVNSLNKNVSSSEKESCDGSHSTKESTETKSAKDEESDLDKRLAMLKGELMNGDTGDSNNNCPGSTVCGDENFTTLRSIDETTVDHCDNRETTEDYEEEEIFLEDEQFFSLQELSDSDLTKEQDCCTQEEIVTFKGLRQCQYQPYYGDETSFNKLNKEFSGLFFEGALKLIKSGIEKMMISLSNNYPQIAMESNVDECRNVVEGIFFPPIIPLILPLYRITQYSSECAILKNMCDHCNDTPKESGVRRKFWLENQEKAPYLNAIEILQELCRSQTPHAKLNHLVLFSKSIIQSIEEYYSSSDTKVDTGVGVDDILPIMTYIIIKSARPELVSECSFMQDFIQEGFSMGEEGFCLTSFDTAVRFVTQMNS